MSNLDTTDMLMQFVLLLQQCEYEEALSLSNEILKLEPDNKTVLQLRELLPRGIVKQQIELKKEEEEEEKLDKESLERQAEEEEVSNDEESESGEYNYEDHPSSEEEISEEESPLESEDDKNEEKIEIKA